MPLLIQPDLNMGTFLGLLAAIFLGIAYASILYFFPASLSRGLRKVLFACRALLVAILTFLLFAPLIKSSTKSLEKPLIILAQDNSASIGVSPAKGFSSRQYSSSFRKLEERLSKDYDVRTFNFGEAAASGLAFDYKKTLTNISSLFTLINDRFSNRNIGAVVLASDGLYNQGGNPLYGSETLKAPVYTIALGDTVPKKDILISNVNYNNIVYLDNKFQIEVSVEAFQSQGTTTTVTVRDPSGVAFTKHIAITNPEFRQNIPVTLLAKAKGIQKYTVSVSPVTGELSRQNNTQTIYVEVIDGRQNVLIVAEAPHPDITALKQAIEKNQNYQVHIAMADEVNNTEVGKANLIILHQIPGVAQNPDQSILRQVGQKPVLFILGAQSNVEAFSALQPALAITSTRGTQEALAIVKDDFSAFTLSEAATQRLRNFAPLLTPFGNYAPKGPLTVLLAQRIGNINTQIPLLAFAVENSQKVGVLSGEGIWRWRLEEFQETGNHDAVDELISKTIQFLSSKDDRRKFRVYAPKNTFDENERTILNAELYNDSYELVNTPDVPVNLKSSTGKRYSYIFSRSGNSYMLDAGILPAGEYSYEAKVQLGSKKYSASGRFIVAQTQIEYQQTTANHQLLNAMAQQSGGRMLSPTQLNELPKLIRLNENIKTMSYENRKYEEMIDMKWVFFLLLALLTLEWFTRKRNGEI